MNTAQILTSPLKTDEDLPEGTRRVIDGLERVFYDGYWIKTYPVPKDTLEAKKKLIEALTRRLFNHTEHGLNIPGTRLREARESYESETDTARKRVKGAMLAGALFNRAADIFRKLVELQACGIEILSDNPLMRECGKCLLDAMELGRCVLHRSGEEGIDELWGEPFRAFSIPVEAFYDSRIIKIAQTLRDIDRLAETLSATLSATPLYEGIQPAIARFAEAAKIKCETLRTDPDIFDVWSDFVVASEELAAFAPRLSHGVSAAERQLATDGHGLLLQGRDLVTYITRARVPMPKSTREFIERCEAFAARAHQQGQPRLAGSMPC